MRFPLRQMSDGGRCAASLRAGEAKRLPVDLTKAAQFYYVACPVCGSLNVVPILGKRAVVEDPTLVSLSPGFVCWGDSCRRRIDVVGGAFEVADAVSA